MPKRLEVMLKTHLIYRENNNIDPSILDFDQQSLWNFKFFKEMITSGNFNESYDSLTQYWVENTGKIAL